MKHNHINDHRFIEVMGALGEASGQESTPFKERIYAQGLEDLTIEQIEEAAWALIRDRTFATFPKIGEIRERVGGKADDIATVQAAVVWKAVKDFGGWKTVCFDDPVTQAVIVQGFGGWQKMCSELMEDKQQWFIKDFCRLYVAFGRQRVTHYGALPGIAQSGPSAQVHFVGDKQRALLIYEQAQQPQIAEVVLLADKLGFG